MTTARSACTGFFTSHFSVNVLSRLQVDGHLYNYRSPENMYPDNQDNRRCSRRERISTRSTGNSMAKTQVATLDGDRKTWSRDGERGVQRRK